MKILTCNIRCFGARDGEDSWANRKGICAEVIAAQSPDIICFQEMWEPQYADLREAFPEYLSYGMVDLPDGRHPQNCIFYHPDRCVMITAGGYWLSESPHVAGTKSWDSACVRLANWVRFEQRSTGTEFRVVNTHLDHISQPARENQARLIVEDSAAYPADFPQILTGDMNCDSRNPVIGVFRSGGWSDTYNHVHGTEDPGHTFHQFLGPEYDSRVGKMDWIFTRGNVNTIDAKVIDEPVDGRFPSDHYFVSAGISMVGSAATG